LFLIRRLIVAALLWAPLGAIAGEQRTSPAVTNSQTEPTRPNEGASDTRPCTMDPVLCQGITTKLPPAKYGNSKGISRSPKPEQ
jgi:hypothetical protein